MDPCHWAWQRQRLNHHGGAIREYTIDEDEIYEIRGPEQTPRGPCQRCAAVATVTTSGDNTSSDSMSDLGDIWCNDDESLSSRHFSSDEDELITLIEPNGQIRILPPKRRKLLGNGDKNVDDIQPILILSGNSLSLLFLTVDNTFLSSYSINSLNSEIITWVLQGRL